MAAKTNLESKNEQLELVSSLDKVLDRRQHLKLNANEGFMAGLR